MFKKVDLYIFKRILSVFLASLLIISGVMLAGDTVKIHNVLFSQSSSLVIMAKIFGYILIFLSIFIIPMSLTIAINYVYSEMSANSEVTALRSSGISLLRLYLPAFVFTMFIFFVLFYDIGFIAYKYQHAYRNELVKAFRNKVYLLLKPDVFYNKFNGGVLWTGTLSADHRHLRNVFFAQGNNVFVSKTASLRDIPAGILISLNNVKMYGRIKGGWQYGGFGNYEMSFLLAKKGKVHKFDVRYMTIYELYKLFKSTHFKRAFYKINRMFSLSISVFVFSLIAFSSGIVLARSGKSAGIVLNIFLFFVFYILLMAGDSLYKSYSLIWTVYLPDIVLGAFGLYLFYVKMKT